jgi:branched-subunit amino acid ABC-type transport system permease component
VGGVIIGVIEQFAVAWSHLGAAYADVLPLAILVVLMALRPDGLRQRIAEPVL